MVRKVTVELHLPGDLGKFRLPKALDKRLHGLLDKQQEDGRLTAAERREAEALVDIVEMLSVLKVRAHLGPGKSK